MTAARGGMISSNELLCCNFNQDATCISIGSLSGYSIINCDPFGKVYHGVTSGNSIVEMLFSTSLIGLVSSGLNNQSTRCLKIINTKRHSTICELTFSTSIISIKLNRSRLIVILLNKIYCYDISNMKLLIQLDLSTTTSTSSSSSSSSSFALSPSSDNSYLAYPNYIDHSLSSSTTSSSNTTTNTTTNTGTVTIFDTISLSVINIIQAHKAPISILSINPTGTLLATASDKGTVIRVFALPNGEKLHEFRRGSYPAKIYSLSFNATSTLLCVSSDTETVHIFKLSKLSSSTSTSSSSSSYRGGRASGMDFDEETVGRYYNHRPDLSSDTASIDSSSSPYTTHSNTTSSSSPSTTSPNNKKSILSNSLRKRSINLGRNLAGSVGGFLPGAVKGVWEPQRDFAFLKLPVPGVRSVVAMNSTTPQVMVITSEGLFYSYAIDLEKGGECILQKSYSLLESNGTDDTNSSSSMGD